jgi:hypothetical protein
MAPKPRHAIANVGGALTALLKVTFRSCLYRVVPPA